MALPSKKGRIPPHMIQQDSAEQANPSTPLRRKFSWESGYEREPESNLEVTTELVVEPSTAPGAEPFQENATPTEESFTTAQSIPVPNPTSPLMTWSWPEPTRDSQIGDAFLGAGGPLLSRPLPVCSILPYGSLE